MDQQGKEIHDPHDKKAHTRPDVARGRQFERRSGTGREETQKKGGAGKANWGNELEVRARRGYVPLVCISDARFISWVVHEEQGLVAGMFFSP